MILGRAALVLAVVLALTGLAAADQYNKRLPGLLDQLRTADSTTEAQVLERRIWRLWIEHEDAEVSRFMSIGISAMNGGNLEVAYNAFDHVVGMAPDFAEGWNKRATVNFMMENFDASMLDIERTLALEPRHFGALSGMGLIFDAVGNAKAAADAWERALTVNPHIPGARDHIEELRRREKGRPI